MGDKSLVLVLGDQLSFNNPAIRNASPQVDTVLLAEVAEEAQYVRHSRHKLVLLFSAMRHFAQALRDRGFTVIYRRLDESVVSLTQACADALAELPEVSLLRVCASGEYRVEQLIGSWTAELGVPVERLEDDRYLCSIAQFQAWAKDRKQLRMEYFYRDMRKQYGLLLDNGEPCGGKWNYDAENRAGWRNQVGIPRRPDVTPDEVTRDVIEQVRAAFPDNPGDLEQFRLAVTHPEAQAQFDWFCEFGLAQFGSYQDALAEESPWLFHSLVSMYLNCGLLEPLAVCQQVEHVYRSGQCSLAAAEGFIRQVLGWREYVRGVYWLLMPEYAQRNTFEAKRPLPDYFWTGDTDLRCLQQALKQSLDLGYAHHIQRLMVIGNFALLAGLDVEAVCAWYLAVYVDAYEWVELPNTLGMALHGDNGAMASKPYAASGKYIQKQGNHCTQCRYNPSKTTGADACPYNSLYWHFIDRHQDYLARNARMGLILGNWRKRDAAERAAIVNWADGVLDTL